MRVICVKVETIFIGILVAIFALMSLNLAKNANIAAFSMPLSGKVILIDAGHGGWDPGKVSENDVYEADINLQIALKLQSYLEQAGAYVLLTRAGDESLGDTKNSDLNGRTSLANNGGVDMFISIHQNSYPDENVSGPQVFYYEASDESKKLAMDVQEQVNAFLNPSKKREARANSNYFMLKKTNVPSIIIECGFMSSPEEEALLEDEDYQDKMAWAIYLGIIDYFEED